MSKPTRSPNLSRDELHLEVEKKEFLDIVTKNFPHEESFEKQMKYINEQVLHTPEDLLEAMENFIEQKRRGAKSEDEKTYYQSKKSEIEKLLEPENSLRDTQTPEHVRRSRGVDCQGRY